MNRDPETGKFLPGNKAAVGRSKPHAAQVNTLRAALFDELSEDRLREIIRALIDAAIRGDVQAAKLCLSYTLGRPVEFDLLERLDALEEALDYAQNQRSA